MGKLVFDLVKEIQFFFTISSFLASHNSKDTPLPYCRLKIVCKLNFDCPFKGNSQNLQRTCGKLKIIITILNFGIGILEQFRKNSYSLKA